MLRFHQKESVYMFLRSKSFFCKMFTSVKFPGLFLKTDRNFILYSLLGLRKSALWIKKHEEKEKNPLGYFHTCLVDRQSAQPFDREKSKIPQRHKLEGGICTVKHLSCHLRVQRSISLNVVPLFLFMSSCEKNT